jgi:acyl carrier protein
MADTETTINAESIIVTTIEELVQRRGADAIVVRPESSLLADLAMESLELAELAAVLNDEVGNEPFSDGIFPETIAELVAFYNP